MSPIFWVDITALSLSTFVAISLALIALGAGPRNALNTSFALFTLMVALWAVFSVLARFDLWLERGSALTLSELATLTFAFIHPLLLIFTTRYVNRRTRRTDLIAILGLAAIACMMIPLFEHRLVFNPRLEHNGSTTFQISTWGIVAAILPMFYTFWSLSLFWQERQRLEEPYLGFSVVILALGFILGGIMQVDFPVLSVTNTLSVALLGYGIISQQIFNPLKQRALELQCEVADRVRVEEALRRSEQEKTAIFDSISELVVYQNLEMKIVWSNQAAGESVNMTPEQLVGKCCYEVWHQRDIPCVDCPVVKVHQTGQPHRNEMASPDGRVWLIGGYPVRNAQGVVEGIVEVTQNITERTQIEKRRLELAMESERANVLRRFIRDASHDLRTPLTAINLSLHMLQIDDPQKRQRHIEILQKQTAHLERLLEDMLSMSRLDATVEFRFEPLNLNSLVQNLVNRQEALAQRKNHTLSFSGEPDLPLVSGDKIHLDQAITQIVVNALHYTPSEGKIAIQTYQQSQHVVIEVQDNGIGIAAEHLPHIFEHFYRGDQARNTSEGGTGLGLAIAKRVIDAHHGHIEVESPPGQGSTFKVCLPIHSD